MTNALQSRGDRFGQRRRRVWPAVVVAIGSAVGLGVLTIQGESSAPAALRGAGDQMRVAAARLAVEPEAARALEDRLAKNESSAAKESPLAKDVGEKEKGASPVAKTEAKGEESKAKPVDPGKAQQITFDTLKFEMEKTDPYDRELIGEKIEGLVGRRIKIRGYMHPSSCFTQTVRKFVFVRDNMECCFGPGAALYDCIFVTMKPGKTTQYTTRPISVEGIFRIEEVPDPIEPDANPQAIYQMEGEAVE